MTAFRGAADRIVAAQRQGAADTADGERGVRRRARPPLPRGPAPAVARPGEPADRRAEAAGGQDAREARRGAVARRAAGVRPGPGPSSGSSARARCSTASSPASARSTRTPRATGGDGQAAPAASTFILENRIRGGNRHEDSPRRRRLRHHARDGRLRPRIRGLPRHRGRGRRPGPRPRHRHQRRPRHHRPEHAQHGRAHAGAHPARAARLQERSPSCCSRPSPPTR